MSGIFSGRTVSPYPRGGAWHKGLIVLAMLVAPTVANTVLAALINPDVSCKGVASSAVQTHQDNSKTGPKLLDIVEITQIARNEKLTECRGTAIWGDGQKTPIHYKTFLEYDKWWVTIEGDPA